MRLRMLEKSKPRASRLLVLLVLAMSGVAHDAVPAADAKLAKPTLVEAAEAFLNPPDDSRVMMRWWWFGPAVEQAELQREIRAMRAGGIGGFEIQPVYPLSLDDPAKGIRNLPYLSDDFIGALRFAAEEGRAQNMRVDLTLGSGWPFGGPHIPVTEAAAQISMVKVAAPGGTWSVRAPPIGAGEKLLAVFVADGTPDAVDMKTLRPMPVPGTRDRIDIAAPDVRASARDQTVLFFLQSRTGQQVKRPGIGAEGFVLDHMSRAAIDTHLQVVGDPLLAAFGAHPPDSVFSDSLEVYRADWTDDLPEEFLERRGYSLLPHLPALFLAKDESTADIRHDWGRTLSELVDERYLTPVNDWARAKGTRLRSQTYGFPPVTLSSNARVALPEGEGHRWREFSTTRWASSGSHLHDQPVTSAEAWTWLHSPAFRATPLDLKAEADTLFLQGANQLIGHGWPYTPPAVAAPGWSLYAAAVFSDQNPWWLAMPDIARYLQRVSHLLRQGEPVNDVAIYLPTNDAWAATSPGRATVSDEMRRYVTPELTAQLLDSGFGFDYVDAGTIEKFGIRHRALILPRVTRIAPETYRRIAEFARNGGIVVTVAAPPSRGAGHQNAAAQTEEVQSMSKQMFDKSPRALQIERDLDLGAALRAVLEPDLQLAKATTEIGFVHRRLADADLYFVANTSPHPIKVAARFRDQRGRPAQRWNALSGKRVAVAGPVVLDLAPYESEIWLFGNGAAATDHEADVPGPRRLAADLSRNWTVRFESLDLTRQLATLASWTDDEATRYYSGVAVYSREFKVSKSQLTNQRRLLLDFGPGMMVTLDPKQRGSRAWLESPVREAAEILVNGQRAGTIWCPPYELDITDHLHAGRNRIELRVGNLGINTLAGRPPADYRLLNARFGERFTPQDMENLQPLPAGLLGPVFLQEEQRHGLGTQP